MPRKIYKPEEIIAKLRQVEVLTSQGKTAIDAIRSIGVTDATFYRWRQEYGGLKVDQVKRMKELEAPMAATSKPIISAPEFAPGAISLYCSVIAKMPRSRNAVRIIWSNSACISVMARPGWGWAGSGTCNGHATLGTF
jgi:putative transposase